MIIKQVFIYSPGDPSVGIFPASWVIQSDNENGFVVDMECFAEEDQQSVMKEFETKLTELFTEYVSGDPVKVTFEFEF